MLGKILADLLRFHDKPLSEDNIETVNHLLQEEIELNLTEFLHIPSDNFISEIIKNKKFNHVNLDKLAEILYSIAQLKENSTTDRDTIQKLYYRAFIIYHHLNQITLTYSLNRQLKTERIKYLIPLV